MYTTLLSGPGKKKKNTTSSVDGDYIASMYIAAYAVLVAAVFASHERLAFFAGLEYFFLVAALLCSQHTTGHSLLCWPCHERLAFFAGPGFKAMAAEQPSKKLRRLAVLQDTQDEAPHPAGTEDRQEEVWEEDPVLDNMEELVECLEEQNRLLRLQIEEMEEQVAHERARGHELQLKIVRNRGVLEFLRSTVGELGHSIANFGAVHTLMQQEPTERAVHSAVYINGMHYHEALARDHHACRRAHGLRGVHGRKSDSMHAWKFGLWMMITA